MEYIYYILIILGLIALSLILLSLPGRSRLKGDQMELARKAQNRRNRQQGSGNGAEFEKERRRSILKRELSKIPTPWGWPGHDPVTAVNRYAKINAQEVHGVSETLHKWVERLIREKQSVNEEEYLLKKEDNMRALLEDRYGHANRMKEMQFHKVKAPVLRNPNQPHDQMDNFPSGKTDRIEAQLKSQPGPSSLVKKQAQSGKKTEHQILKKPWGW